ncbi:MAG: hypothetical protein IJZ29_00870 [Clostridia bacterium]|nr:hypothetical protein [Clostridia bacterium]
MFNFEENFDKRKIRFNSVFNNSNKEFVFKYQNSITKSTLQKHLCIFPQEEQEFLTYEEALEDFNQFKYYIHNFYSGYFVFNTMNFEKAFYDINKILQNKEKIKTTDFIKLILEKLNFIIDKHFCFQYCGQHYKLNLPKYKTYYNADYQILKIFNKFYITINRAKYLIKSINGNENIESFLKKGINNNGIIVSALVIQSTQKEYFLNMELGNRKTLKIPLKTLEISTKHNELLDIEKKENFTLIHNQRCYENSKDEKKYFLKNLAELKNAKNKIFVINAIDGQGGDDEFVFEILKALGFNNIDLIENEVSTTINGINFNEEKNIVINKFMKLYESTLNSNSPNILKYKQAKIRFNEPNPDNVVIVLNSRNTLSASESYINLLPYKNVIFLGDYTGGCFQFCPCKKFYLNKSGACIKLGSSYFYLNDLKLENVGYEPDLFLLCANEEKEQAISNFVHNYLI